MGRVLPLAVITRGCLGVLLSGLLAWSVSHAGAAESVAPPAPLDDVGFGGSVKPLLAKYCLGCHATAKKEGGLDLERFTTVASIRRDVKPWQHLIEQVEAEEMPPREKPQPTAEERMRLVTWTRNFLDAEARARTGDPGRTLLRRLSNAEYDATIRDLTGVDLRPAREFPVDGAGGEGFTNAGESLSGISPALLSRYMAAAKEIANHAVLLPEGFRFSPSTNRRDWTIEATESLKKFYAAMIASHAGVKGDGGLDFQPYLLATVRDRDALAAGKVEEVAAKHKLNVVYLRTLWQTLSAADSTQPLDSIRAAWRQAKEADVPALAASVAGWQGALWRTDQVGNYSRGNDGRRAVGSDNVSENLSRQVPVDSPASDSVTLRVPVKAAPGQSEVAIHLAAREPGSAGPIVWHRPRFEGQGKPVLLLRDYADYGPAFEADIPSAFTKAAAYLSAVVELTHGTGVTPEAVAEKQSLDVAFLKQWVKVLGIVPLKPGETTVPVGVAFTLLDQKTKPAHGDAVRGWAMSGADLPVVVANSSDKPLPHLPARSVVVHPTPGEFVAIVWKSPIAASVTIASRVVHVGGGGNGVAWQLEHRRGDKAKLFGESLLDPGQEGKAAQSFAVEKGDLIMLAVDPRDGRHESDSTEVALTITEDGGGRRAWDLGKDVVADIQAGNPHADSHGNAEVWSFVRGAARKPKPADPVAAIVPGSSVLGQWRAAAADPARRAEAAKLAEDVARLLGGPRPADEKDPNRLLYDRMVSAENPLFAGVDLTRIAKPTVKSAPYGLPKERFVSAGGDIGKDKDKGDKDQPALDSVVAASDAVVVIRLPAALLAGREFVVDAKLPPGSSQRFVRVLAASQAPDATTRWTGPVLATAESPGYKSMVAGNAEFRKVFPLFCCFPPVKAPHDVAVSLKMFHREDEPLLRLFATAEQARELDRLWDELTLISRQPEVEYDYFPQMMGFASQDTSAAFQKFYADYKPVLQKRAEDFLDRERAAAPRQLAELADFAARAYRRPLSAEERSSLQSLYDRLRAEGVGHDEAFRGVVSSVLVSPAFLFRIESPPAGKQPARVNDHELATRLSYFLWSSMPDAELREAAASGRLRDPAVLAAQAKRMLQDPRARALAIEFGTQWIHVRGLDEFKEKSETLYPTFNAALRRDLYEESILFFLDFFQADRPVRSLLDADHTFVNEAVAKHYGIPGVGGPQWRRIDGVRKFGRGGILGLASVHAKQSGASRTSPVLRGTWVVETLLGEKLPKPPKNVPQLPDQEGLDNLTTRQLVERHVSDASCAACHARIDPYGFAFENFDAIGRFRTQEAPGRPVDTHSKLRDGTEFAGLDGLREYLLAKKQPEFIRLFCQRLLGYALGRSTTLSDMAVIDRMAAAVQADDGRVSGAIGVILESPQFLMVRGKDAEYID
jgi:hypothetical protein